MRKTLLALVPALTALAFAAQAADLEVGPGQTYATIQAAVEAAMPGDAVLVHAGDYTEELTLSQSGTSAQPISVRAAGDGTVTLHGVVNFDGSYWELSDITIVVQGAVRALNVDGDHNKMLRLDVSGGTSNGVDGSGTGNEVRESKIHDFDAGMSDAHCIVLNTNATDWVISGNELSDCSGDGVQLYGPSDRALRTIKNTRIEGNVIRYTGAIMRMENAVDVKDADGLIIANNVMSGFVQNKTLVFQKGPANIEVRCNEMYGGFTGVEFRAESGGVVEAVRFLHNVMHDYTDYALKFDGTQSADVLSNTFVDAQNDGLRIEGAGLGGGQVRNNLWLRTGNLDAGTFDADHNGYFEVNNVGFSSPTDVQADPLLDAAFALGAGSPMIDAGADVGIPFAGAAPDIGAFEVGLDACGRLPGTGGSGGGPGAAGGGGPGGPGAGGGAASGPSGAGGTAAGASGGEAGDDGGCGCRTVPGAVAPEWLFAALAVAVARRRHRGERGRYEGERNRASTPV